MEELSFQVIIDSKLDRRCPSAVAFGDFESDDTNAVYVGPSALTAFFHDLLMGRAFPLTFATREVRHVGTLVAVALFLHRELAIEPAAVTLVASAELFDRHQYAGLAHIDRDLARFFRLLSGYLPAGLVRKEQYERLTTAVGWIHAYITSGELPSLPREPPPPRVLDVGTNGFVVAEMPSWKDLDLGWVDLYRQGFLRGVLLGAARGDRRAVLAAKKGSFLSFDLEKAAVILNEAERAMGELDGWLVEGFRLRSPEDGTLLLPSMMLGVFTRV